MRHALEFNPEMGTFVGGYYSTIPDITPNIPTHWTNLQINFMFVPEHNSRIPPSLDAQILQGILSSARLPDADQLHRHGGLDLRVGARSQGPPQVQRDTRRPPRRHSRFLLLSCERGCLLAFYQSS